MSMSVKRHIESAAFLVSLGLHNFLFSIIPEITGKKSNVLESICNYPSQVFNPWRGGKEMNGYMAFPKVLARKKTKGLGEI